MKKPNVLVVMCDQMRGDALGCNGNPVIKTPNIDFLAQTGVNFNSAYTPNPICVPARACMTTGHYPHKCTGVKDNHGSILPGFPLLGDEFNKRGYTTYGMGKLHYLPYRGPGEPRTTYGLNHTEITESGRWVSEYSGCAGLEDYIDYLETAGWKGYSRGSGIGNNDVFACASPLPREHYVDSWVADRSLAYLRGHLENSPDKPFFMLTSFPKPHSPYDPPRPYDSMYDPRKISAPSGSIEDIQNRGLSLLYEKHLTYDWNSLSDSAKKVIKAHYYGLITHQDYQIGRLIDFLKRKNILDDTVILYTADHGDMMGDFGLFFKQVFYTGAVRIPMILRYPRELPQGFVSDELAGLQDVLPTLLSLTGSPLEVETDGADLVPCIKNRVPLRPFYVSQCMDHTESRSEQQYMLADKSFKYIYHEYGGTEELYNLENDPAELVNLSSHSGYGVKLSRMRNLLIRWCGENGDSQILRCGELAREAPSDEPRKAEKLPFGRRHW